MSLSSRAGLHSVENRSSDICWKVAPLKVCYQISDSSAVKSEDGEGGLMATRVTFSHSYQAPTGKWHHRVKTWRETLQVWGVEVEKCRRPLLKCNSGSWNCTSWAQWFVNFLSQAHFHNVNTIRKVLAIVSENIYFAWSILPLLTPQYPPLFKELLIFISIFIGPRCPWGPICGSCCLY